ncbi:DNA-processing protein DprA [Amycolatopsis sp. NPDC051371]|uniref:DNA-processing protein DprA n=1 Tax=Amycolatopsis sp. NPDC051371 TaxID=3155800 RepID=UPI00344929D0
MPDATDARHARAFLHYAAEPTSPHLARYVTEVGPVEAARRVDERSAPTDVLDHCRRDTRRELATADLEQAAAGGARFVIPEDDEWPTEALATLTAAATDCDSHSAPLGLWVRGEPRLDMLVTRSVVIVGSRAATEYGEHHAGELAYSLASRNVVVFSGAAYGIDGAAHRGALATDVSACTVAVLGCGIDIGYPAGHVGLLERIARTGAVVSQYPPRTPPARHRFIDGNRLLAALTRATVIVEAGLRSGARTTAHTAAALGRPVLAVPGPVDSVQSTGCHQLIQNGTARLATCAEDILAAIADTEDAPEEPGPAAAGRPADRR